MKINDIYTNLEKNINLKKFETFLGVIYKLEENKNIDNIKNKLKQINLKKNKLLKLEKQKSDIFD